MVARKICWGIVCCVGLLTGAKAQDINFSQFYELPMLRNPALTGIYQCDLQVVAAYRNQWNSVTVPYSTTALGGEMKFGLNNTNSHFSLGLMATNDIAGDSKLGKTQLFPVLAYHQQLNSDGDSYFSFGAMGGPVYQRFDPSKLSFDDQFVNGAYSPTNPTRQTFITQDYTYWDLSIGTSIRSMLAYKAYYYIGAAYFHLNRPKVAFNPLNDIRLNSKFVVNGGITAYTDEDDRDRVTLYADYFKQGGSGQMQGGLIYRHALVPGYYENEEASTALSLGVLIRWRDALVPIVKMEFNKMAIGLSYDVNTSKLKTASQLRGGFELTLSYMGCLNSRRVELKHMRCKF